MSDITAALPCPSCGVKPHYKHVEQQQEPYRSAWQGIVAYVRDAVDRDNPIYPRDLERELHRLIDGEAEPVTSRTVNTTRYGRED